MDYQHLFTPHSVIQTSTRSNDGTRTRIEVRYYEVLSKVFEGYALAEIDPETGAIVQHGYIIRAGQTIKGLGLVAPTHPVYQRWATRRLQDRLEGLEHD